MKEQSKITKTLIIILSGLAVLALASCSSGPEGNSLDELEEWDLLWISDSSGWDVADVYAEMVAEDTGKTINVNDKWIGGLPAGDIYLALTGQYAGPSMTLEKMPE